jgi:hypothetical protein
MNIFQIDKDEWETICIMLSLDCVYPLYESLGLKIKHDQALIHLLRRLIVKYKQAPGNAVMVQELFDNFTQLCGEDQDPQIFFKWATTIFCISHSHRPEWGAWMVVFMGIDWQEMKPAQVTKEKKNVLYDYYSRCFVNLDKPDDAVEYQLVSLKSQSLSEWDKHVLSFYNLKEEELSASDINEIGKWGGYNDIVQTIEMNRFQSGWSSLWADFTNEEIDSLVKTGKNMLNKWNVLLSASLKPPQDLHKVV